VREESLGTFIPETVVCCLHRSETVVCCLHMLSAHAIESAQELENSIGHSKRHERVYSRIFNIARS